jgi:glucosamine 6-phosphate synthetase-like amidotransferase/phosphosugar isomerase protein
VVLVLGPPGNALDRAEELVAGIAAAGGRAVVVGHPTHGSFPGAHARLDVAVDTLELLTPVLYHVPVQLLVLHLARRAGVPLIPLRRQDDYWLIRGGVVRSTAAGLS